MFAWWGESTPNRALPFSVQTPMSSRLAPPLRALALALALLGCAPPGRTPRASESLAVFTPEVVKSRLACLPDEHGDPRQLVPPEEVRVLPSQLAPRPPSSLMLDATTSFERGEWSSAIANYWSVIHGDGDDDDGTKGRAELQIALAHMRDGEAVTALSVLERIARDPHHSAHHAALFSIIDLVLDERTNLEAIDVAYLFAAENYYEVGARDPELESLIHFVWGRGFYRAGQHDPALRKMNAASRSPRLARRLQDHDRAAAERGSRVWWLRVLRLSYRERDLTSRGSRGSRAEGR